MTSVGGAPAPRLSIVIPALNESRCLTPLLGDVGELRMPCELIVVDGGSVDDTASAAAAAGARVEDAPRGRGIQLATGARAATGDVLCFLHADVRLDSRALAALEEAVRAADRGIHVFRLRIGASGLVYRLIELMANNLRTRLLRLPYGDQGLIVSRSMYDLVGGYRALPLMEDVEIVRALRRRAPLMMLDASVLVSARRWQRDGPWRRTFRNWAIMIAYSLGVPVERLARWYGGDADADTSRSRESGNPDRNARSGFPPSPQ